MRATDIFTPTSTPTVTYVDRSTHDFEGQLARAMTVPNLITSVAGPSKSGKTVLIEKVIDPNNIINIAGSAIRKEDDLWSSVLDWMEVGTEVVTVEGNAKELGASLATKGTAGLPLFAGVSLEGSGSIRATKSSSTATRVVERSPFNRVVKEIGGSDFVVFVDDFHYINSELQPIIGRSIKSAAEAGVRIIVASVPHRSDDVVRSNPELRGRVQSIDLLYWSKEELKKIAASGFPELGIDLSTEVIDHLAVEAFGSPQLMQALCLNLCFEARIVERRSPTERLDIDEAMMERIAERAATLGDFSTLTSKLHSGPKQRGTERNQFQLLDGTRGDVYRAVLLAIASKPSLSISYRELQDRVAAVSPTAQPVGSSVSEAVRQMEVIASQVSPDAKVIEWDDDVLEIVEPYFLFFLRSSHKLQNLGRQG